MANSADLIALAAIIQHDIKDPSLFAQALTHGSTGIKADYQRLEFLGDRVLGMVIASQLYSRFPKANEGQMASWYNRLVSRESCAEIARKIDIAPLILLGKQARDDGGTRSNNILGDVIEALIGALYIDDGLDAARKFILARWGERLDAIGSAGKHPKSEIQEWAAAHNRKTPEYNLIERTGPPHAPRFVIELHIKNIGSVRAEGSSKQEAETLAAAKFLTEYIA